MEMNAVRSKGGGSRRRIKKKEETILAEFESAISSEAREQPETGALTITLQDHPNASHYSIVMCTVRLS